MLSFGLNNLAQALQQSVYIVAAELLNSFRYIMLREKGAFLEAAV